MAAPFYPPTLPSNTVVGRLANSAGPAEAIPFSTFEAGLNIVTSLNTLTGALTLVAGTNVTITPSGGNTLAIATSATILPPIPGSTVININASHTVVQSDNGTTLSLGGNSFFPLIVGPVGSYSAPFGIFVINEDGGRGKTIQVSGLANFILWPGQNIRIVLDPGNGVWLVTKPPPWQPSASPTFYVNATSGNDANDGLIPGSGAFATIQAAVYNLQNYYDAGHSFQPTIQLDDGTHNVGAGVLITYSLRGSNEFTIQGNSGAPTNTVVQCASGGNNQCFYIQEPATVTLQNMYLIGSGGAIGINMRQFATCDISNLYFNFPGGLAIKLTNKSSMGMNGNITIYGAVTPNAYTTVIYVLDNSFFSNTTYTITISGTLDCTYFFAAQYGASINLGGPIGNPGNVIGTSYYVDYNSQIRANGGASPPGSIGGTPGTHAGYYIA
jgi:hypothetical protein